MCGVVYGEGGVLVAEVQLNLVLGVPVLADLMINLDIHLKVY